MKKLRKRLMSWLMVVAFVFSTFAPFMPMTVHAAPVQIRLYTYDLTNGSSGAGGKVGNKSSGDRYPSAQFYVEGGSSVTIVAVPDTGYTFKEWREGSQTGTIVSTNTEYTIASYTELKSYYAIFESNSSTPETYSAELNDLDLGTADEGYDRNDYAQNIRMKNTGTATLNSSTSYKKVELTAGNVDSFSVGNSAWGTTISPNATEYAATIVPKANLTAGTYTATATLYYDRDGDGTSYTWEAMDTATLTFKVYSQSNHNVSFNTNGGGTVGSQTIPHNGKATRPATDPVKTGWHFMNWYLNPNKNTTYDDYFKFDSTPIKEDIVLEALYSGSVRIETADTTMGQLAITEPSGTLSYETTSYSSRAVQTPYNDKVKIGAKANPGYEFVKWTLNGSDYSTSAEIDNVTATDANMTLVAVFQATSPTQYTVTFKNGLDSTTISTTTVNDGEKVARPSDPTAPTGYTFDDWYADAGMTIPFDFDTPITAHTPIYAKFIPNITTYTVTIDPNNGTSEIDYMTGITSDFSLASPSSYGFTTPSGKEFDGWLVNGTKYDVSQTITISASTTAVAQWKDITPTQYTVTFINGNDSSTINTATVNENEKVTRPTTDPTMTNYTFDNWYADAGMTIPFDFDTPITAHTPIYAKFIPNSVTPVEHSIIVTDGAPDKTSAINGETITITADVAPSGKEFDKWVVEEGTITLADVNSSTTTFTMPDEAVKVKATYKDITVVPTQYTITFINGIDSSTINTAIVNDGEKVARPTTDPTMANHTFDNWYSDAGMTTPFDFDTPITAHTPIYAKFIPNSVTPQYAATVEDIDFGKEKVGYPDLTSKAKMIQVTNNGTENLNIDDNCITLSGDVDKFDILIAYNTPLISGQTKGINWIKPKNGLGIGTYTVIATFKDKDNKVTATANITFTVTDSSLTEHTITVVDGTSSKTSAEKNETITITADSAPSGKEFDKWVVEEGTITLADVNNSVTTFTMPDEAVKVKATYKDIAVVPTQYTITFINGNDSSTIDTATVNENEKATRPTTDPTMANHTFDNWYSDAGMTIPFDFDTPITAHTPIYAKFIPNSVTPTYVIESGANQTYTIDSNVDVVIKASGAKANLSKIQIDGTDLDTANYNTEEGSTILTLKASYLNTLSEGDHTVKFVYNDGDVSTNLKVVKNTTGGNTGGNTNPSNPSGTNTGGSTNTGTNTNNNTSSPQTSDNIVFYIMTMLVSLFGIAGASVYVNRKKLFNR